MPKKRNKYIDCGDYYKIELYFPFTYTVMDIAMISKEDLPIAQEIFWHKTNKGYAKGARKDGKEVLLHKHITGTTKEVVIDHINQNKLDCRRSNLRVANKQVNSFNRGVPSNSTTGHVGVSFDSRRGRYRAYGKIDGKQIWLGYYDSLESAAAARMKFEEKEVSKIIERCEMIH